MTLWQNCFYNAIEMLNNSLQTNQFSIYSRLTTASLLGLIRLIRTIIFSITFIKLRNTMSIITEEFPGTTGRCWLNWRIIYIKGRPRLSFINFRQRNQTTGGPVWSDHLRVPTDWPTDTLVTDKLTDRQTDRGDWQMDWVADWQTRWLPNRLGDWQMDWVADK